MITDQGLPFIGRTFGATFRSANRSLWGRNPHAYKSMMNQNFGVPCYTTKANGSMYILPTKGGSMLARNLAGDSDLPDVALTAIGILTMVETGEGLIVIANIAAGVNSFADIYGLGEIDASDMEFLGNLGCEILIGSKPSADEIVFDLMDTPSGYIDGVSFRDAIKRILAINDYKLVLDDVTSTLKLYDSTGTVIIRTWPMTDKLSGVISLQNGTPSQRGKPT